MYARPRLAYGIVLMLVVRTVGCGGETTVPVVRATPEVVTSTPPPVQAPLPDPRPALLTLADLPAGWQVTAPAVLLTPTQQPRTAALHEARVAFRRPSVADGASHGALYHDVLVFAPGEAAAYMARTRDDFVDREVDSPTLGEETFAVRTPDADQHRRLARRVVWVRRGDVVLFLSLSESGPPPAMPTMDTTLFERLARVADARLAALLDSR